MREKAINTMIIWKKTIVFVTLLARFFSFPVTITLLLPFSNSLIKSF